MPDTQPISEPGPGARAVEERRLAEVSVARVLGSSLTLFARHSLVLIPLAALAYAGPTYFAWRSLLRAEEATRAGVPMLFAPRSEQLLGIGAALLPLLLQAVVALAIFRALRTERPDFLRSLGRGVLRFPHALGAGLLVGIVFSILLSLSGPEAWTGNSEIHVLIRLASGALLICFACRWFVAVQAAVIENSNPYAARSRSAELTQDHPGPMLGLVLLVYVVPPLLTPFGFSSLGFPVWFLPSRPPGPTGATFFLGAGLAALISTLQGVTAAVTYDALRRARAGTEVDELAAVFD